MENAPNHLMHTDVFGHPDIESVWQENLRLRAEVQKYRAAASLYGIDATTMLALAKSKILTSADNIRLMDMLEELFKSLDNLPENIEENDVLDAIIEYDGDGSKPYADLVYCGLKVVRTYLSKRKEYERWRKENLLESQ